MNVRLEPRWLPDRTSWLLVAAVLTTALLIHWAVGAALLFVLLVNVVRPFDFILAFLMLVSGASFIFNEGGGMTQQLALLSVAIVFMLICYLVTTRERFLTLPLSGLTLPLFLYLMLSFANAARGVMLGFPLRNLGLEFVAILAVGTALLVGNVFDSRRDLRLATLGLIAVGMIATARGLTMYSVVQTHTVGIYTMAVPGIVGLLIVNLALRADHPVKVVGWTLLSMPLFLHQFITFGRGLWTGCLGGLIVTFFTFAGVGRGSGRKWARILLILAVIVVVGLMGVVQMALVFGHTDILVEAGTRLSSITSTKPGIETRSNVIRLFEYSTVLRLIQNSPWFGYGIGFTFPVEEPFIRKLADQWGVHQNFLMVWLKQGLVGLVLFIWMLVAGIVVGVREARKRSANRLEANWFATSAAATTFLTVFSLSNYPFAVVNETFLLAMLWGGCMAMTCRGLTTVRWSAPAEEETRHIR